MKARQRWRAEEDGVLLAYVQQYGPREWHLVSERMNTRLDRDAKSCLERWKNYLKPGIKRGSLTEDEQRHVIHLQAEHGNKWKKIAAQVPGRTPKRLGKWWEVFKEKQHRCVAANRLSNRAVDPVEDAKYQCILDAFAEKLIKSPPPPPAPFPVWLCRPAPPPPSVTLPLTPTGAPAAGSPSELRRLCLELEEGRRLYLAQKREAGWRLRRLELQLESEKAARKRKAVEDAEAAMKSLRDGEKAAAEEAEDDCRKKLACLREETEAEERTLVALWLAEYERLLKCIERLGREQ